MADQLPQGLDPVTLLTLPIEIQLQILRHLTIPDLQALSETCLVLNKLINDEELWKGLFLEQYHTTRFSSLSQSSKFSIELFERTELRRAWRRGVSVHKSLPLNITGVQALAFQYPKLTVLTDQGTVNVISLDKGKIDTQIPVTTPNGCTSFVLNPAVALFGRVDGRVFCKLLGSKTYLSSVTQFKKQHGASVSAIESDDTYAYTGDLNGWVYLWNVKSGVCLHELEVSGNQIKIVKGYGKLVLVIDSANLVHLINFNDINSESTKASIAKLQLDHSFESHHFDLATLTLITSTSTTLHLYQLTKASFGKAYTYTTTDQDSVHSTFLEYKPSSKPQNTNLAGQDGRNLALLLKSGLVLTFNIRNPITQNSQLQPLTSFYPCFDTFKVPSGVSPISGIDINSTTVLVASFNGFAAIYDVLTGAFVKVVSTRIPKRYLPLNEAPFIIPTNFVRLGRDREGCFGLTITNSILQFFQFGDLKTDQSLLSIKKKKNLAGVANERRNKYHKLIKHGISQLDYEEELEMKNDKLLKKYNGDTDDVTEREEMELAMVLNQSLNEHRASFGQEGSIKDDIDDDLQMALTLSKLEFDGSVDVNAIDEHELSFDHSHDNSENWEELHLPERNAEILDEDAEFQRQLEEAMRRSVME